MAGSKKERPKPLLTVQPEPSQIFIGDKVTLTCDIQGEGWTYTWQCGGRGQASKKKEFNITAVSKQKRHEGEPKPLLTVQPEPSQIFIGDKVTLTCDIQGEGWTYTWQCGGRGQASKKKEFNITAVSKQKYKPKITVKPQSSVFTGDTVTLSCNVGQSTGWTIFWFKDFTRIKTGDKMEILSNVSNSNGGQYRCSARKGKYFTIQSQRVVLPVSERPKPAVRVQPDGHVFRGQTVTLTCDIQETDVSSWSYSWNKDDSVIHVSQSQEYRISSVNESHTGNYSCTGRETQGSRYSHTSDKVTLTVSAPLSVLKLLSFLLAASPYLLVSVILGVKCYRAHVQTDDQCCHRGVKIYSCDE
ncbi:low affinity immunoglobulin gamma Fc region receptor III-like [Sinocyclocheilus anshuiensis]|uniref:low affinity immunoglobulin gamma Fc region receptor III-like n=1 Tax=Sinocyclocheilus anshuiensis TaxID=1608454 RepID=UPI0007B829F5|nr:PREDICTED: low affinity immunoglobulin gamma Fc region receptor III-like [Sinocyclocheilus anshuiensis]